MSYEVRASQIILRAFDPFLRLTEEEAQYIGSEDFKIPKIDVSTIIKLCDETIECYIAEEKKRREEGGMSHLLHIPLPAYVVGDLHGNLHDFFRILSKINLICNNFNEAQELKKKEQSILTETKKKHKKNTSLYDKRFIFLGDYVDRGDYSLELIMILFALKIQYPQQFFLIRGNHEFTSVNSQYGFLNELVSTYGGIGNKLRRKSHFENVQKGDIDDEHIPDSNENEPSTISHSGSNFGDGNMIWRKFNQAFEYIPLAAVLGERYFCIHGGLSPHLSSLDSLNSIPYPLDEITQGLVSDLLWSDPSSVISEFVTNPRGAGVSYGERAMKTFLTITGLKKIIRAHEKQMNGVKVKKHIMTVFSTSGYSDSNQGGFCFIKRSKRSLGDKYSDSNSDYDKISDDDPNPNIESDSYGEEEEEERSDQVTPRQYNARGLHPSKSFRSVHLSADHNMSRRISASFSARTLEPGSQIQRHSDGSLMLNTFAPYSGADSNSRICPLQKKKNSLIKCFIYDCRETPKRSEAFFYDYIIPLQKIKYVHSANGGLEIRNNCDDDDDKLNIDQCGSSFSNSSENYNNVPSSFNSSIVRPVVKLHAVKSFLTTNPVGSRPMSSRRIKRSPLHNDSTAKCKTPPY